MLYGSLSVQSRDFYKKPTRDNSRYPRSFNHSSGTHLKEHERKKLKEYEDYYNEPQIGD